ncbi:MAG: T9SS type A sorting domain-containing protein [Saprospiraceae bacterium]|nr:T9SS type A sorting domain-containing protein [Saprospiraceae bacterium]
MLLPRYTICLLIAAMMATAGTAQEWRYEGPKTNANSAGYSWTDAAGNSYHNISEHRNTGTFGRIHAKSLLVLDKDGNFNGRVQIGGCRSRSLLLPFNEGRYLTNDYDCIGDQSGHLDSRVFDHKGRLLFSGDGFKFSQFTSVMTPNGYTAFSVSMRPQGPPKLGIRDIDWDFNMDESELDLSEMMRSERPMFVKNDIQPVRTSQGQWVLAVIYGQEGESRTVMTPTSGALFLTDGKRITGRMDFEGPNEQVEALQLVDNQVAVLTVEGVSTGHGMKRLYFLDEQHLALSGTPLSLGNLMYLDAFLITEEHIVLTQNHYDWEHWENTHYSLSVLDRSGNLLSQRTLEGHRAHCHSLLPLGKNSLLLSGEVVLSDSMSYSLVMRLNIVPDKNGSMSKVLAPVEPQAEAPPATISPIGNMTIEELSPVAISVAVYPNPASISINFALKQPDPSGQQSFELSVFSMEGKLMRQAQFQSDSYELDIADYPPGTYAYRILASGEKLEVLSGKFVKLQ